MLFNSIEETIGKTPLVRLNRIRERFNLNSDIYAKLESFNPGGSVKDRPAMKMLDDAVNNGKIREGSTIVEPTSGNTGIGLALASVKYGLKVILVMPSSLSAERIALMKAYGAEVVLTEPSKGMKGAIEKAYEISNGIKDSFIPMQFENSSNPAAHFETTAREILSDLDDNVDIFVSGVGTGGTITGTGNYLKLKNDSIKVIAVEPQESAVLSGELPSKHGIQGIGAGFVPPILDTKVIDSIEKVPTEKALEFARIAASEEKILCGISSGAALCAAVETARKNPGKNIVVVFPDTGERYISTALFNG
ncbi:MAG: cysteine synthase A [Clostridia bacterium]|nr:cysteine synthase A [Clostridia bacterium]